MGLGRFLLISRGDTLPKTWVSEWRYSWAQVWSLKDKGLRCKKVWSERLIWRCFQCDMFASVLFSSCPLCSSLCVYPGTCHSAVSWRLSSCLNACIIHVVTGLLWLMKVIIIVMVTWVVFVLFDALPLLLGAQVSCERVKLEYGLGNGIGWRGKWNGIQRYYPRRRGGVEVKVEECIIIISSIYGY